MLDTSQCATIVELAQKMASDIRASEPDAVLYDLGCGKTRLDGFLGVDYYFDTDVKADLFAEQWDFVADGTVSAFYSSHFIEHVQNLNRFMSNAWRKLKAGGFFLINAPYGLSVRAWQDPDHKRPIFRQTYAYFNKKWREDAGVDHYEADCDFDIVEMWPVWNKDFAARAERNPQLAEQFLNTFNAVDDLTCLLRAIK